MSSQRMLTPQDPYASSKFTYIYPDQSGTCCPPATVYVLGAWGPSGVFRSAHGFLRHWYLHQPREPRTIPGRSVLLRMTSVVHFWWSCQVGCRFVGFQWFIQNDTHQLTYPDSGARLFYMLMLDF